MLNSDANAELFKAVFGGQDNLESRYQAWRSRIRIADPFDESTFELLPLLGARLREGQIADDFSGRLTGVCRKVWVETQGALTGVSQIVDQLGQKNIPATLSGRSALAALYPDQIRYTPSDPIVLTVQKRRISEALESLRELGWEPPHWVRQIDMFETDAVILFDAKWRSLRLSWQVVGDQTAAETQTDGWGKAVTIRRRSQSYRVLTSSDAAIEALTDPSGATLFERSVVVRRFIQEAGDWDILADRLTHLGKGKRAADNLRELAEIFGRDEIRQTLSRLDRSQPSLAERLEEWGNALGDRPIDHRFRRATNFMSRRLREKQGQQNRQSRRLDAGLAMASYAAFRLTPARFRKSTVFVGGNHRPSPSWQSALPGAQSVAR